MKENIKYRKPELLRPKKKKKVTEKKVLVTFQAEERLRELAQQVADNASIVLSDYLRNCLAAFVNNKKILERAEQNINETSETAIEKTLD